uniref:Uncharacterized protein n=1 Tax=Glossina palpalis gambiensis TaxID=67801 RepID=A0A1B0BNV3_9MUSC
MLTDRLTKAIGELVTIQDVVRKIYAVSYSLKRVDRRRGGQTRMTDCIWYARKLGLVWAVRTIKGHISDCKNLQINADNEDDEPFLGFELGKNQVTGQIEVEGEDIYQVPGPIEVGREEDNIVTQTGDNIVGTDVQQRRGKTDEPTTMVDLRNIQIVSPDILSDDIYICGPSTSDHVRLIKDLEEASAEKEALKRRLATYEGQLEPQPDSVVPDVGELSELVKCLTTEDKVVQISFDEVFTNNLAVYSRKSDTLTGCQYADDKKKETCSYKTMLVFGARSLATAFNLILSSLKDNGEEMQDDYDWSIFTKFYKLEEPTNKFWILRGAVVRSAVPRRNDAPSPISHKPLRFTIRQGKSFKKNKNVRTIASVQYKTAVGQMMKMLITASQQAIIGLCDNLLMYVVGVWDLKKTAFILPCNEYRHV